MTDIIKIQNEVATQLANKEVLNALVATTFKGLAPAVVKTAIVEGRMRGFEFKDFLEKNVYAIPFRDGYSLVTSIDYARKIGMRSGIVGKSAPTFEEVDGKIVSCTVTVKKRFVDGYIGDFTATVYFDEYNTSRNQWVTKKRTMIAKVGEMHALRMACPEELSQSYSEEEVEQDKPQPVEAFDLAPHKAKLEAIKSLDELKTVWSSLPIQAKNELKDIKDSLKKTYEN